MSIQAGVSWSNLPDPFEAGQEAATLALNQMGEDLCDLAFVFSAPQYSSPELLEGIRAVTGRAMLLGCTDAGNLSREGVAHRSVAVMLVRSEGLEIRPGAGDKLSEDPEAAGEAMAKQAQEGRLGYGEGPGTLLLAFCEGARGNLTAVLRGAQRVVGTDFPIVGGAAGDDSRFVETTQYCLNYLLKDAAVGFLMGGSVRFGVGTRHGWRSISRPREVTRSDGALIREIDNRPALQFYQDYLQDAAADITNETVAQMCCTYPLGFQVEGEAEPIVRYPRALTPEGHLVVGGEVAQGSAVRLMWANRDSVVASAREAARESVKGLGGNPPRAVVVFSCFARERVLGRDAGREIDAIREVMAEAGAENVPLIGYYSYGELAPAGLNGSGSRLSQYRNNSVVVMTMG